MRFCSETVRCATWGRWLKRSVIPWPSSPKGRLSRSAKPRSVPVPRVHLGKRRHAGPGHVGRRLQHSNWYQCRRRNLGEFHTSGIEQPTRLSGRETNCWIWGRRLGWRVRRTPSTIRDKSLGMPLGAWARLPTGSVVDSARELGSDGSRCEVFRPAMAVLVASLPADERARVERARR
jgi:hypothetical protein